MDTTAFFSRAELLGGQPARRASTLLFAVESLVASLAAESRRAAVPLLNEATAAAREGAFLSALARGREVRERPGIWELERYAPQWAGLVPIDPGVRAAAARQLGQREHFDARDVPGVRAALGLDALDVRAAFERAYGLPLDSIYTPGARQARDVGLLWARATAWIENLPPFWTSFALTLTELVGGTMLALPIATAGMGPLPGVAVVLVLGLINMLTIAALAEAAIRSGPVRYGGAYFGGMVRGYLGGRAAVVFSGVLFVLCGAVVLALMIGIASTLAAVSGVPALAWAAGLFGIQLFFVRRGGLGATVASALMIGAVNLLLLFALMLLALPHLHVEYLLVAHIPFVGEQPLDPALLGAVFGTLLLCYVGHLSTPTCASLVLRRDPSGRSLMAGCIAAMATAMGIYALWVLVIGGAVAPDALAAETGTPLAPLAVVAGPIVRLLGAIFVVLSMGLASIHVTMAFTNQFQEWLPARLRTRSAGWLAAVPSLAIFLSVAWLLATGQQSFVGIVGLFGALTTPLFAGAFPALLLLAARRRGEYVPGRPLGRLGHPVVLAAVLAFFLGVLLLHGLVIWQRPFERAAAIAVAVGLALLAADTFRCGLFAPRAVVELRAGEAGETALSVVASGAALAVDARVDGRQASVALPATGARELKLWAHRVTATGASEPMAATVELAQGGETRRLELGPSTAWTTVPFDGKACEVHVQVAAE